MIIIQDFCVILLDRELCEGRRIVNVNHLFTSIQNIYHDPFGCTFKNLECINEKRCGYFSELYFKCRICNKIELITTENTNSDELSINKSVVTAVVNTGIGYSQLDKFSAILNIPSMSNSFYQKLHEHISMITEETALESMIAAGKEESKLAIEAGDVNSEGIPMISVVADGAWSKRSYKINYNALSGVVSCNKN